jgi:hypothetical protein
MSVKVSKQGRASKPAGGSERHDETPPNFELEGGTVAGTVSNEVRAEEGERQAKGEEASEKDKSHIGNHETIRAAGSDNDDRRPGWESSRLDEDNVPTMMPRDEAVRHKRATPAQGEDEEKMDGPDDFFGDPPSPTWAPRIARDSIARSTRNSSAIEWQDDFLFDDVPETESVTALSPPPPRRNTDHTVSTMPSLPERPPGRYSYLESPVLR